MRIERIMCPVDFSESSTAALDDAASLAEELGARLLIVHVDEHPLQSGAASSSLSSMLADRLAQLEYAGPGMLGVPCEHHLIRGNAAEEIPRFARAFNVDLVVMGCTSQEEHLGGPHDGICQIASRSCTCPVMTINHAARSAPWMC